ncbi:MAG: hypothetical protein COA58_08345 [Bacteroidetes bacterium]|nr:MAG: hypothetical protein COA58_08345 [Bacteroidota bacterium]
MKRGINTENRDFKDFMCFSFLIILVFLQISTMAQNKVLNNYSIGGQISTNGVGLDLAFGTKAILKSDFSKFRISISTFSHPNETKVQNPNRSNPKPYVFGKLNSAGTIRFNYGFNKNIGASKLSLPKLSYGFSAGPTLGILKPYYIGFQDPESLVDQPQLIQQNEYTNENQDYIYGPASWTRGFSEIEPKLGLNFDAHFTVNWNNSFHFKEWKSGIRIDYFPKDFKILYNSNQKVFTSIYTAYSIGRY